MERIGKFNVCFRLRGRGILFVCPFRMSEEGQKSRIVFVAKVPCVNISICKYLYKTDHQCCLYLRTVLCCYYSMCKESLESTHYSSCNDCYLSSGSHLLTELFFPDKSSKGKNILFGSLRGVT